MGNPLLQLIRKNNDNSNYSDTVSKQQNIENSLLKNDIEHAKKDIETLLLHLDYQTDPDLIDCYTYELKGAYMRYKFLLRQIQETSLASHNV